MSMDPSGAPGPAPAASDPTAALTDIRNQLLRLGQQIAEMRADPAASGAEAANGVIAELREAVRFLAERLDGVARMVAQRGEELADTRGALSAIDAHVRSQAETIGVLTTGMQALPSYGERVSSLQDNINGLQQRLAGIEAAFGPLGQRLGSIETAVSRPDSAVSERLAALEGMIGPMSQRLGQSLTEHNASLQALHGRVEALAAGTQAGIESLASSGAVASGGSVDEGAALALEPKLASLASELASLRSEVSALAAASPTAALAELKDQITELAKAKSAAAPAGKSGAVARGDIDAAVAAAETRIKDHVDDAIIALAQTLLGKARADGTGAVAPVDEPAASRAPVVKERAAAPQPTPSADAAPSGDAEDGYDDEDDDFEDEAEVEHHDPVPSPADPASPPIVAWSPPPTPPAEVTEDSGFYRRQSPPVAEPFDQDADWDARGRPDEASDDGTVVPEGRRRWFSW
ncbi:MAG TPA: hypothetical protein VHW74_05025 [Mycobacteriales bacterium]|nr:hypothetical protein [Mycobacteriales bacterium]